MNKYCLIIVSCFFWAACNNKSETAEHKKAILKELFTKDFLLKNPDYTWRPTEDSGLLIMFSSLHSDSIQYAVIQYSLPLKDNEMKGNAYKGLNGIIIYQSALSRPFHKVAQLDYWQPMILDTIYGDNISLKLLAYKDSDPRCCPSAFSYKKYRIKDTGLVEIK